MFLCKALVRSIKQIDNNNKTNTNMANNIKLAGLILILIGAVILILSYFFGWNNINAVNVGAFVAMITGLVTYIIAGKKALEK